MRQHILETLILELKEGVLARLPGGQTKPQLLATRPDRATDPPSDPPLDQTELLDRPSLSSPNVATGTEAEEAPWDATNKTGVGLFIACGGYNSKVRVIG